MAINKIAAPLSTSPSVFAAPVVNQLLALVLGIDMGERVSNGYIKKGAMFNILGDLFVADSDTLVSGTESGSVAIKFTVSGNTAVASYVSSMSSVSWNGTYQGFYDSSNNMYFTDYIYPGDRIYQGYENYCFTVSDSYIDNISFIIPRSAKWRIKFFLVGKSQSAGSDYRSYAQIYKNGVAISGEFLTGEVTNPLKCTLDYEFSKGDVVTIKTKGTYHWSSAYGGGTYPNVVYVNRSALCNNNIGILPINEI